MSKPLDVKKGRNNNPKVLAAGSAFTAAKGADCVGTCANIKSQVESFDYEDSLCSKVSAPYVLSRLIAMFPGLEIEVLGQDGYKVTWQTILVHKETGHIVTWYDYKSGISYGSDVYGDRAPKSFIRDLKKLVKALADERFPHPYDGCVIGEIA